MEARGWQAAGAIESGNAALETIQGFVVCLGQEWPSASYWWLRRSAPGGDFPFFFRGGRRRLHTRKGILLMSSPAKAIEECCQISVKIHKDLRTALSYDADPDGEFVEPGSDVAFDREDLDRDREGNSYTKYVSRVLIDPPSNDGRFREAFSRATRLAARDPAAPILLPQIRRLEFFCELLLRNADDACDRGDRHLQYPEGMLRVHEELMKFAREDEPDRSPDAAARINAADATAAAVSPPGYSFSDDYRSACLNGQNFSFTTTQAAMVQCLAEHAERGTPDVSGETLIERSGSSVSRIDHAFRGKHGKHPAWKTLIVPGSTKGTYRLAEPRRFENDRKLS